MGRWAAVVLAKPAGRLEMLAKGALIQLAEPWGGGGGGGKVDGTGCLDAAGQASWGSKFDAIALVPAVAHRLGW